MGGTAPWPDESHDGAWWRAWWEKNRERYPEAVRALEIPTLTERGSDSLDFHEVSVWSLLEALRLAYSAGYEQAVADRDENRAPPAGICPRCGEDDIDQLVWDADGTSVTCQRCGTNYVVLPLE